MLVEPPGLPAGAGPVWTGGFAFAPDGGREPQWSSLPPALMVLPELSLLRDGERCSLTLNAMLETDGGAGRRARRRPQRGSPRSATARSGRSTPTPLRRTTIGAPHPPGHYEAAGRRRGRADRAGELEKAVLAREVRGHRARGA